MKKKSAKILSAIMVLGLSAALCACGGGSGSTASETGNNSSDTSESGMSDSSDHSALVFGLTQEISSVDPHEDTDAATRSVLFNVFEGLVKPTTDGEVEPAVAQDYTVSDDMTEYTFTLRDGITFHDGNPVTAEDVKYSLERSAGIDGDQSALSAISDISTPDDSTVVITLSAPDSEFIYNLTTAILEEANDAQQADNPIGTGPFKLTEFEEGQYLTLEKYDGYWNKDLDYIDEVQVKFVADADEAFMELQSGSIDCLQYLTKDQISSVGDDYNIITTTMMLVHGLFLNNDYEPLQNKEVRQALNYAVDRDAINEMFADGKGMIVQTHGYPRITAWYNKDTEGTYTYDPDKAKELLADAGYADGFDLEITVPSNFTQHVTTAEMIAENLKAVGINATINSVDWNTWLSETYQNRNYQATVIGFDISSLSPATWYKRYYSTSDNDMTNFASTEYDSLYDQAQQTTDNDTKKDLYGQMQQILTDDAASVFIQDPGDFIALNKRFTGLKTYPVSALDFSSVQYAN
jgi:peptide/nickel transport system substrate-binding protein